MIDKDRYIDAVDRFEEDMTARFATPHEFQVAGLKDAYQEMCSLLAEYTQDDVVHGPRWKMLSRDELWEHLYAHVEEVEKVEDEERPKRDYDTNHLTMAHVVVRAMMLLQQEATRT